MNKEEILKLFSVRKEISTEALQETVLILYEYINKLKEEIYHTANRCADYVLKKDHILEELKKWLEVVLNELKENDIYDRTSYETGQIAVIESIIAKIEELEEGVK